MESQNQEKEARGPEFPGHPQLYQEFKAARTSWGLISKEDYSHECSMQFWVSTFPSSWQKPAVCFYQHSLRYCLRIHQQVTGNVSGDHGHICSLSLTKMSLRSHDSITFSQLKFLSAFTLFYWSLACSKYLKWVVKEKRLLNYIIIKVPIMCVWGGGNLYSSMSILDFRFSPSYLSLYHRTHCLGWNSPLNTFWIKRWLKHNNKGAQSTS